MKLPPASLLCLCACAAGLGQAEERQMTFAPHGHVLTNTAVWSPDGRWLAYDVRAVPEEFTGDRIERVDVDTGLVEVVYRAPKNSACGVVTWHPTEPVVVFIQGPENPTPAWSYGASRRRGVTVDLRQALGSDARVRPLDAMNYAPPFTPGALRGGSHVHVFSGDGRAVSFTYDDELLARPDPAITDAEPNQRNVGVAVPTGPVHVTKHHPRNQDGDWFSVLVTRTVAKPRPGSDEISRAFEEAWIGRDGYLRADGARQPKALAFQGRVTALDGREHDEVFVVDLPEDLTLPGDGSLTGTASHRPAPPAEVAQRRLTVTADRIHRGIQGPRHWLRSSPDGTWIAFLLNDDAGITQLGLVSPCGGPPRQLTKIETAPGIASAFSWHPDGSALAAVINSQVCVIDTRTGQVRALTPRCDGAEDPLDLACVFSPDGRRIAYQRRVSDATTGVRHAQLFVVTIPSP